jgi:methionyl-tRNA formyltransferase
VYERVVVPIDASESVAVLRDRLVGVGIEMMVRRLADGFVSLGSATDQVGESTYAAKLDPTEFVMDFTKSADELSRVVRLGFAWTTVRGKRLKVLEARPMDLGAGAGLVSGVDSSVGPVGSSSVLSQGLSQGLSDGLSQGLSQGLSHGALGKIEGFVVVGCGSNGEALVLITVQPEGKGPMAAAAWANGLGRLEETMLGQ